MLAPRRERPVALALPPLRRPADVACAMGAITEVVAQGTSHPARAALAKLAETAARAIGVVDIGWLKFL